MDLSVDLVVDLRADLAEGPWWDEAARELVFVDITGGRVCRFDPQSGRLSTVSVGQPVGAAIRRRAGGLVVAVRDGVALMADDASLTFVCDIERDVPTNRMNDCACDAVGRLWGGTMAFDTSPGAGSLYRVEPTCTYTRVLAGVTISNGIGWSADNQTMYYIDSPTGQVDAFDFDLAAGTISGRRQLIRFGDGEGYPDGLTVDADGYLWVASFGGGTVRRYSPDGKLDGVVRAPASKVTSCAFGGPDLGDLYITTAAIDLDEDERGAQPHAGGVFRCRPGVTGRLDHAFAG